MLGCRETLVSRLVGVRCLDVLVLVVVRQLREGQYLVVVVLTWKGLVLTLSVRLLRWCRLLKVHLEVNLKSQNLLVVLVVVTVIVIVTVFLLERWVKLVMVIVVVLYISLP